VFFSSHYILKFSTEFDGTLNVMIFYLLPPEVRKWMHDNVNLWKEKASQKLISRGNDSLDYH